MNEDETMNVNRPDTKTQDSGKLRIGDCMISAELPKLNKPDEKTRDTGAVRIGDCMIAGRY